MTPDQLRQTAEQLNELLRRDPANAQALHDLGIVHHLQGNSAQAIDLVSRAAEIAQTNSSFHYNHGWLLSKAGRHTEAIGPLERAIALKADDAMALNALGNARRAIGRLAGACAAFERGIAIRPEHSLLHNNYGLALQQQGRIAEAIASFRRAMMLQPPAPGAASNYLLCLNYDDATPDAQIFAEHVSFAASLPAPGDLPPHPRSTDGRIRIGYLSPDFRSHSVAFFIWPILESQDRARFEVTCYSDVAAPDAVTNILRTLPEHWRDVAGMNDDELRRRIGQDQIDILVELSGHTAGNRLRMLAHRCAPIQVTYLGYPNTTGLRTIDYRITDAIADPPGTTEALHSETLVRLPEAFFCYRPADIGPEVVPLPARSTGRITFGVFTNYSKVRPAMVRLWAKVLHDSPGSKFLLQAASMDDDATRDALTRMFADAGIAPERLDLRGWIDFPKYLAPLGSVDIVLDTFPFNGHTTSCHALHMGAPVVTLAGRSHRSRMGMSLLVNLGLGELVAQDGAAFVRIAADLAADPGRLERLRLLLRDRMRRSAILDSRRFCRNLEAAYERVLSRRWGTYRKQ